jgi:Spy/CpxP family protein refolding chaperone
MKKIQTIIVASVLVMGMVLSGAAFADSQGKGDRHRFGFNPRHTGGGLVLLAKYQQRNLMVQVLSEMADKTPDAISTKLKEQGMRAVIQELNIDRQAVRAKMREKVNARVNQAVENGTITTGQAKEILANMENRSRRREVMKQLIEKGLEDGTITQEQAQMLMRKPPTKGLRRIALSLRPGIESDPRFKIYSASRLDRMIDRQK